MKNIICILFVFCFDIDAAFSRDYVLAVEKFNNSAAVFLSSDHKYGLIDSNGNILVKAQYESLREIDKNRYLVQESVLSRDLYWLMDKNGNQVTQLKYDFIKGFGVDESDLKDYFKVGLAGFVGVIDIDGKEIAPLKYRGIFYNKDQNTSIFFEYVSNRQGLVTGSADEVLMDYGINISDFNDQGLSVIDRYDYQKDLLGKDVIGVIVRKGVIDKTGKVIVPPRYLDIRFYQNGLIAVKSEHKADKCEYATNQKKLWAVFDKNGNKLTSAQFLDVNEPYFSPEKLVRVDLCNHRARIIYGYMGADGKMAVPLKYDFPDPVKSLVKLTPFSPLKKDKKFFYLNDNLEKVKITEDYELKYEFPENGLILVETDRKEGVINKKGEVVVPVKYRINFKDGYFFVSLNLHEGVYAASGKLLIPVKYDWVSKLSSPFFSVGMATKAGFDLTGKSQVRDLIDLKGKSLGLTQYKEFEGINRQFTVFRDKNNAWGVLGEDGKVLIYPKFLEKPVIFQDNLFIVKTPNPVEKDKWVSGVVDIHGREVISAEYDVISKINENVLQIFNPFYTNENFIYGQGFASFEKGNLKFLSDVNYCRIEYLESDLLSFAEFNADEKKCFVGVMRTDGKVIIPPKYQEIILLGEGMVRAEDENKWIIVNSKTGESIIEGSQQR